MRQRTKTVLEKDIENRFVKEAKKLGCITRKLNGMGYNSWPDRLILVPGGVTLFFEFKRPGEHLRPAQAELHLQADTIGHTWYTFDSWEIAIAIVRQHMRT